MIVLLHTETRKRYDQSAVGSTGGGRARPTKAQRLKQTSAATRARKRKFEEKKAKEQKEASAEGDDSAQSDPKRLRVSASSPERPPSPAPGSPGSTAAAESISEKARAEDAKQNALAEEDAILNAFETDAANAGMLWLY